MLNVCWGKKINAADIGISILLFSALMIFSALPIFFFSPPSFMPLCYLTGTPTWGPALSKSTLTCSHCAYTQTKSGECPEIRYLTHRGFRLHNHSCWHILLASFFTRNECFQVRRKVSLNDYIGMVETFSSYQVMLKKDPTEAQRLSQHIRTKSVVEKSQLPGTQFLTLFTL